VERILKNKNLYAFSWLWCTFNVSDIYQFLYILLTFLYFLLNLKYLSAKYGGGTTQMDLFKS